MYQYDFAVPIDTKISDLITDIFYLVEEGELTVRPDGEYRYICISLPARHSLLKQVKALIKKTLNSKFIFLNEFSRKTN